MWTGHGVTRLAAFSRLRPAAVTYSGRVATPRRTAAAWVALRKALLAHQPRGSATVKGARPLSLADLRTDLGTTARSRATQAVTLCNDRSAAVGRSYGVVVGKATAHHKGHAKLSGRVSGVPNHGQPASRRCLDNITSLLS